MPIDALGAFFPPPIPLDPDRPHRVEKTDRDGRADHKPEPRPKRRGSQPDRGDPGGDGHHISIEA